MADNISKPAWGLYIHAPFCVHRCAYCDFFSQTDLSLLDSFVHALTREMDQAKAAISNATIDTIYFGGGTPSLLSPGQIQGILDQAAKRFDIAPHVQITLEANPGTVDEERFKGFRRSGVNRLNLGIQSFDDQALVFLGRIHNSGQGEESLRQARRAGFDNLGLDLIYGLPAQTAQQWERELATALDFSPQHLSCYQLTLEPGTDLYKQMEKGKFSPVSDLDSEALFLKTHYFLSENEFHHYEISNYCLGMEKASLHNLKYWTNLPYLGLGPGAHSYDGRHRWWNRPDLAAYIQNLNAGGSPRDQTEKITTYQAMLECLSLGLRTSMGLDKAKWEKRFGINWDKLFGKTAQNLARQGMAQNDHEGFALTAKGMLLTDAIAETMARDLP